MSNKIMWLKNCDTVSTQLTCTAVPIPGTTILSFGDGRTDADGEVPLLAGLMFCPCCTELPQCLVGMVLINDASSEHI
jgi:hypothetical protein